LSRLRNGLVLTWARAEQVGRRVGASMRGPENVIAVTVGTGNCERALRDGAFGTSSG